jgi:hypothetical protein
LILLLKAPSGAPEAQESLKELRITVTLFGVSRVIYIYIYIYSMFAIGG